MSRKRERWGDRPDGVLLRDMDALHTITAIIYPNRCDNEGYIHARLDLTAVNEYLAVKNAGEPEYKYNLFQIIVAALAKIITLRPVLNRFIVNGDFYQRKELTLAFVVKRRFADGAEEGLAVLHISPDDTIDTIHEMIRREIFSTRSSEVTDSTESTLNGFNRLPRWIMKAGVRFVMMLDKHGRVPPSFIDHDPYYCSAVLSNVGSIGMKSGYHHLTNWGTCSLFCLIGEAKMLPVTAPDGTSVPRMAVDIGLTIDERLADGYYYAKTLRLLRHLIEHPELLEQPMTTEEAEYYDD
ncbi:MAG: 2-oxo acid dehydrogenase subunit E2 [Oscillospiraceae bacterium]|nr:2-oxo acid dehydrogenase subunit E2 [Oscillospiraceae bacterium]